MIKKSLSIAALLAVSLFGSNAEAKQGMKCTVTTMRFQEGRMVRSGSFEFPMDAREHVMPSKHWAWSCEAERKMNPPSCNGTQLLNKKVSCSVSAGIGKHEIFAPLDKNGNFSETLKDDDNFVIGTIAGHCE